MPHLHDLLARDQQRSGARSVRLSADAAPCLTSVARTWRELAQLAEARGDEGRACGLHQQADRTTARRAQLQRAALRQLREIADMAAAQGHWELAAEYEERVAEASEWLATDGSPWSDLAGVEGARQRASSRAADEPVRSAACATHGAGSAGERHRHPTTSIVGRRPTQAFYRTAVSFRRQTLCACGTIWAGRPPLRRVGRKRLGDQRFEASRGDLSIATERPLDLTQDANWPVVEPEPLGEALRLRGRQAVQRLLVDNQLGAC
jgi:hypothetical protein